MSKTATEILSAEMTMSGITAAADERMSTPHPRNANVARPAANAKTASSRRVSPYSTARDAKMPLQKRIVRGLDMVSANAERKPDDGLFRTAFSAEPANKTE